MVASILVLKTSRSLSKTMYLLYIFYFKTSMKLEYSDYLEQARSIKEEHWSTTELVTLCHIILNYSKFSSHVYMYSSMYSPQEILSLHDDKGNYETAAKESLCKVLQEKLDAEKRLCDAERGLSNTEDECTHLQVIGLGHRYQKPRKTSNEM
jgi:hypothetical protein